MRCLFFYYEKNEKCYLDYINDVKLSEKIIQKKEKKNRLNCNKYVAQ